MKPRLAVAALASSWLTIAAAEPPTWVGGVVWVPVAVPVWNYPASPFFPPPFAWWLLAAPPAVPSEPVLPLPAETKPAPDAVPTATLPPVRAVAAKPAESVMPPLKRKLHRHVAAKPAPGKPRRLCWKDDELKPCP